MLPPGSVLVIFRDTSANVRHRAKAHCHTWRVMRHTESLSRDLSDYVHNFDNNGSSSWLKHRVERQVIKTTKPGRDGSVRVTFTLPMDEPGGAVSVVGNFNDWNPHTHPLRKRANKTRSAAVTVKAGSTLRFRYLAEGGVWFDDETIDLTGQDAVITV